MTSILITGSSRGIGLNLVRRFLEHPNPPKLLIATCRNPEGASDLLALAKKYQNLQIIKLDVDDIDGYPLVVEKISSLVGEAGLNVLINNAAIAVKKPSSELTWQDYRNIFHTNTIAPIFLSRALLSLVQKAAKVNKDKPAGIHKAAILNITSLLGSVSANHGKGHAYPESKTALNMAARTLASEVSKDGILVVNLHPGWVQTELGGKEAPLTIDQSISGLINVIYSLNETNHDGYIDFEGKNLPW